MTRYQHLADLLAQRIEAGLYQSGERLPSVRTLSDEHSVSISTVQQAYHLLEDRHHATATVGILCYAPQTHAARTGDKPSSSTSGRNNAVGMCSRSP